MDVFLLPLVDKLNELWVHRLETHNTAYENSVFKMRVVLLWTVNDFPARSSLFRWSGHGYKACPTCNEDTPSMRLIEKNSLFWSSSFPANNHHWWSNLQFDGRTKRKRPPHIFSMTNILEQLCHLKNWYSR